MSTLQWTLLDETNGVKGAPRKSPPLQGHATGSSTGASFVATTSTGIYVYVHRQEWKDPLIYEKSELWHLSTTGVDTSTQETEWQLLFNASSLPNWTNKHVIVDMVADDTAIYFSVQICPSLIGLGFRGCSGDSVRGACILAPYTEINDQGLLLN